jgi:integrase
MRRKRFQRGSLKPRKRKGKIYWYAQWREEGKPKSKELGLYNAMSRVEAEIKLQEILKPINEGAEDTSRREYSFERFVEEVYIPVFEGKWKSSTATNEIDRLRYHLVAELGSKVMESISREEMQRLLNDRAKAKKSRSLVDHLRFRLRSIFELAISEGVVDRNPAATLFTPRHCAAGKEKFVLTPEESTAMIAALSLREKLITRLATWEGMRPGEILALQIGDLETNSLWVRRRLYKGNLDVPKTKRSYREVALTTGTIGLLSAWRESIDDAPETWLFASENGNPIRRDWIWRRYMLPKLKPIQMEWATFQVMRRTFATLSKKAGVDAHTRSAQMGNTVDVNENEYAVATFEQKLAAVRRLESTVIQ